LTSVRNPYIWDDSADHITTGVIQLDLYDSHDLQIQVNDLTEDIIIDITPSTFSVRERFSTLKSSDKELKVYEIQVDNNDTSVHITIRPETDALIQVFVKAGSSPTVSDADFNITIPADVTGLDITSASLTDELQHTVFLSPEFVQEHGAGLYVVGVKLFGKIGF